MKKFNTRNFVAYVQRLTMLALALGLLASCSAIKLTYANADTLSYWWLNSYIDIDSEQKPWLRNEIAGYLRWHRQTQLPDYAQLLREGQARVTGNPTAAQLEADFTNIRKRAETALDHALPQLADLALTLKPHQIARIEKKFLSNNDDYRRKYMRGDTEKRMKARYKRALEQAEFWYGRFSNEQEERIRKASDARPLNHELWLEQRIERQRKILAVLARIQRERPPREQVAGMLGQLSRELFAPPAEPEHKAFFDAYTASTAAMAESIMKMATPVQKAHAVRRIQELIADCAELSAAK
jgi:hypothetical protein